MKLWRPKNPKSVALVKITLWSGILVWMLFFVAYGVVASRRVAIHGDTLFGSSVRGDVMTWILAVGCVFIPLLACVAIARFVNKKLGKPQARMQAVNPDSEDDEEGGGCN